MMWRKGWRDRAWVELDSPWDVVVIGGGVTGAGILREATRVGLRTLLLEARDFASGTSSRSSKLVHGGLRYLRNGQVRTTVAAVHERERLLREGKGLINPLGFLYVSYEGDRTPLWVFGLGLVVYDLLGLHWGHKRYDPAGLARLAPAIRQSNLKGGYRYFDAVTDDARLVLRIIREGVRAGGLALNYAQVQEVLRRKDGRVCGVAVQDSCEEGNGRTKEILAKVVVNATGASADRVRSNVDGEPRLRRLRGSHLIFPAGKFPLLRAICYSHPVDGRPVFAIPWEGVTLFGTTDVDHGPAGVFEPVISDCELDYLMTAVNHVFPSFELTQADIQATLSGIRAVVNTGKSEPSKESREHAIWMEEGLLTVTGGKLTTFRVMAFEALRAVRSNFSGKPSFRSQSVFDQPLDSSELAGLAPGERLRLMGRYGWEAPSLVSAAHPGELMPVDENLGSLALWAELRWAARAEGVVHLDDLLLRRVRLGLLLPEGGMPLMDRIRDIVQPELGWDDRRWRAEVAAYAQLWCKQHQPAQSCLSRALKAT
jgi:glycerol-3-phosphate dehydrogenase